MAVKPSGTLRQMTSASIPTAQGETVANPTLTVFQRCNGFTGLDYPDFIFNSSQSIRKLRQENSDLYLEVLLSM